MSVARWARRGAGVVIGLALLGLTACDTSTLARPDQPVVLTGASLPLLVGATPERIVAFAHSRPGGTPTWTQVPVQVDQRKVVDFGTVPGSNATPGVTGTVYGTPAAGVSALQYADAGTFVGADSDTTFDSNDELVFMASDAGGVVREAEETTPAGVVAGSGVRVQLVDPLGNGEVGWVYLFRATPTGGLTPAAGQDYVSYAFTLTSGAYKTTYKRADGPNPETSLVTGTGYQARLRDRWDDADWRITAGGATGVDILDGLKSQFPGTCGRSNITFQDAWGAFVANIDGPVRAIRSYVGANSGPYVERTNLFYRDRQEIVTDLRVHAISGVLEFLDYSSAAINMTYRNSVHPGAVTIDGVPDAIGPELSRWELVTGNQGSVSVVNRLETSGFPAGQDPADHVVQYYEDDSTPVSQQCWGDAALLGASGSQVAGSSPTDTIGNTDPRSAPFGNLRARRTVAYDGPGATGADAARLADQVDTPLGVTAVAYSP
ncbi:MAG: hypothetical protein WKF43_01870 [Acidimicrobiales bacterium]